MELQIFDVLLLMLIAIALALIMGAGIIFFVDKKLNDVQINVPPCPIPVCPKPICPKSENTSHKNESFRNLKTNSNTNTNLNKNFVNNFNENFVNDLNENFVSVGQTLADPDPRMTTALAMNDGIDLDNNYAPIEKQIIDDSGITVRPEPANPNGQPIPPLVLTQEPSNYSANSNKTETILLRQGYSSSPTDTSNIGDNITYPSADDIVRYNGDGCYKDEDIRYMRKLEEKNLITDSCRPYAASTREEAYNKIKVKMMTAGSNSANYIVDEKINFYVPRLYMGKDPTISGISYAQMNIENPADVDQIGSIPVDDYNGEPVPLSAFDYD